MKMKILINSISGCVGGIFSMLFGGWSYVLTALLIMMVIDYVSGLFVAISKKSKKTESGGLSSSIGLIGIFKKVAIFLFIIVAYQLDILIGVDYIKNCVAISFILNELLSIIENMGLLGIPIPPIIKKVIDILNKKEEENNENN